MASVEELTVFLRSKSIEAAEKELVTVQEYANKNGYAQLEYKWGILWRRPSMRITQRDIRLDQLH